MKQDIEQIKTEKQWDKKYKLVHLDTELYPNKKFNYDFLIFTKKEIDIILKRNLKRMKEYNKIIPNKVAGFDIKEII